MLNQAIIFCGGRGERLGSITKNIPKPMVMINRKPFLYYLLCNLRKEGIKNFLILTGYKSVKISNYFGDGNWLNIKIEYSRSPLKWETSRRLLEVKKKLNKEFLICYSDNLINFNLKKHLQKFKNSELTLTLFKKKEGNIKIFNKTYEYNKNRKKDGFYHVELGYILVKKKNIINIIAKKNNKAISFYFNKFFKKKTTSVIVDHYHSISTPKRLKQTKAYFSGKKIILIDRDGTINKRAKKGMYIKTLKNFKLISSFLIFLKKLSMKNFHFIIITNQAGVGRKLMSKKSLDRINQFMIKELKKRGINIIKIYTCHHHWQDKCECRKPKPHMINKAASNFNLNLKKTIYIGDDERDWQTARNAKCRYVHINEDLFNKSQLFLGHIKKNKEIFKIIDKTYK
tara:strand:+ start:266 stop:1462 length:1197 start_codon:yes stop_codon:yes gene_type:complete